MAIHFDRLALCSTVSLGLIADMQINNYIYTFLGHCKLKTKNGWGHSNTYYDKKERKMLCFNRPITYSRIHGDKFYHKCACI